MIANPVKKQYDRDQIAYLLVIAIAKSVLSLEHIQVLFDLQNILSAFTHNFTHLIIKLLLGIPMINVIDLKR